VNGRPVRTIDTHSDAKQAAFQRIDLPKDAGMVELRPTAGTVRVYGVSFEKKEPGIVYDSLGLNGASTIVLSRVFRQKHWAEELQHRHPDLVIINYGTNESGYTSWIDKQYEIELRTAIQRVKAAVPETSILIVSPMDRGERSGSSIHTMPGILHILKIQERVALDTGCGFFNTFEAMGGDSTMARWYDGHPRMVAADLIHPSPQGARLVSEAFVREIVHGLNRYKARSFVRLQAKDMSPISPRNSKSISKAK
jgi:lysophospholipase L1-like esterase